LTTGVFLGDLLKIVGRFCSPIEKMDIDSKAPTETEMAAENNGA